MGTQRSLDPNPAAHRREFFRNWLSDPFRVASIAPSGRMLAKRMSLGLREGQTVIELGAGTGTLTHEILAAGVADAQLHLVENNANFASILERDFPRANVHCIDADDIATAMPALRGRVDCIVSGLPILWFDRRKKVSILEAVFTMLRPGGFLQQFTYVVKPPIGGGLRAMLDIDARLVGLAPLNFPPAFVYRFSRRAA